MQDALKIECALVDISWHTFFNHQLVQGGHSVVDVREHMSSIWVQLS